MKISQKNNSLVSILKKWITSKKIKKIQRMEICKSFKDVCPKCHSEFDSMNVVGTKIIKKCSHCDTTQKSNTSY